MAMAVGVPCRFHTLQHRKGCVVGSMRSAKQLVESGTIRSVSPKDVATLMSSNGYKLVDIRPKWERENAFVEGSYHVALFVEDEDMSPVTLLKKWIHFGYIGAWMGHKLTTTNSQFLEQISQTAAQSKEDKLLVACGEGLRSLIAVEKLHNDGYKNLAWIDGGFGAAKNGDFPKVVGSDIRYANVGGFAHYFLKLTLLLQGSQQ